MRKNAAMLVTVAVLVAVAVLATGCGSASTSASSGSGSPVPVNSRSAESASSQCALEWQSGTVWVLLTVAGANARAACAQAVADSGSWPPDGGNETFTTAPGKDVAGAERQSPVYCTVHTPPIATSDDGTLLPDSSTGLTLRFYGSSEAGTQAVCFGVVSAIPGGRSSDS